MSPFFRFKLSGLLFAMTLPLLPSLTHAAQWETYYACRYQGHFGKQTLIVERSDRNSFRAKASITYPHRTPVESEWMLVRSQQENNSRYRWQSIDQTPDGKALLSFTLIDEDQISPKGTVLAQVTDGEWLDLTRAGQFRFFSLRCD